MKLIEKDLRPVIATAESAKDGVAIDRVLPYGKYYLSVRTSADWVATNPEVQVEFGRDLDLTIVAPDDVERASVAINGEFKPVELSGLRFGTWREPGRAGTAGYFVMNGLAYEADYIVAWPTAEIAVMGPDGAVNIIHRKTIEAVPEEASDEERAVAFAKALARRAVLGWEGIGDADGNPIDPTPEAIDALLDVWPIFEAFQLTYVSKGLLLEQETNASALSPSGPSAGASATAKPARKPARTARRG